MQEATITDPVGVAREYAFDAFNGSLFVKDFARNPGRPYRPIYAAKKPDEFGLRGTHAEMWKDPAVAQAALASDARTEIWRSAH